MLGILRSPAIVRSNEMDKPDAKQETAPYVSPQHLVSPTQRNTTTIIINKQESLPCLPEKWLYESAHQKCRVDMTSAFGELPAHLRSPESLIRCLS